MKVHKFALIMSVVCIIGSLALVAIKGLNFGIDFSGGILIEARMSEKADISSIREVLSKEVKDVQIQNIDGNEIGRASCRERVSSPV